jgi:hypothetical protein
VEKYGYGSLQELCSWDGQSKTIRNIAQSEPDVRMQRNGMDQDLGVSHFLLQLFDFICN